MMSEYQECCNKVMALAKTLVEDVKLMILLIDNYDSFTYNLYQYIGIFTDDIKVVTKRQDYLAGDLRDEAGKIVLSPGPKSPKEAGICMDLVKEFYDKIPILWHLSWTSMHWRSTRRDSILCKRVISWKTIGDQS